MMVLKSVDEQMNIPGSGEELPGLGFGDDIPNRFPSSHADRPNLNLPYPSGYTSAQAASSLRAGWMVIARSTGRKVPLASACSAPPAFIR